MQKNILEEKGFTHIMGPSPAIVPGRKDAWDGWILESCDIFKDEDIYYWYYHARGDKKLYPKGYRIGVATAPTPLGPWTRYEGNPILDYGPVGSWDEYVVACICVMKEGAYNLRPEKDTYYMWYSAAAQEHSLVGPQRRGGIGLAVANSPVGPWKRYEGNPVVEDFGYLGGVVKVNGKFYMYTQYPVEVTDQGPFCVATADRPEGPWTKYDQNPILTPGDWGAWDDGGYSEAGVRYNDGVFHCFYGGTKTMKLESIGYAYSFDGYNFTKYSGNPIIPLTRVPNASGFAEVKALFEPPFIYLYHTLRYISHPEFETEDLAIQVLSTSPTFRLSMPILHLESLEPNQESTLEQCCPVGLDNASGCALTVECRFASQAKAGLRLHVRSSYDGIAYNTHDLYTFDFEASAAETVRRTVELAPKARFLKVTCESLEESSDISLVKVMATVVS
ncbi:hypothetical protein ES704_03213 [subsurface metagenome]|jgi:hypothetical protein